MKETTRLSFALGVALTTGLLSLTACMSDRATNTPLEEARYPLLQSTLDSACAQFCAMFVDALDARFETDTSAIPGLEWPFEMPLRRRTSTENFPDTNTSWGASYDVTVDTTRYVAFEDLGRLVDTGTLTHMSPIVATRVEHRVLYGRADGSGDSKVEWDGTRNVILTDLDSTTAGLVASITARYKAKGRCNDLPCDQFALEIADGQLGRVGDDFEPSTLSGTITGSIRFTEAFAALGFDAEFEWEITGTITDGVATITASTGEFTKADLYSLCP